MHVFSFYQISQIFTRPYLSLTNSCILLQWIFVLKNENMVELLFMLFIKKNSLVSETINNMLKSVDTKGEI